MIVLSCLLGIMTPLSIFFITNLSSKNKMLKLRINVLEAENRVLEYEKNDRNRKINQLKGEIEKLQNKNFCVGAIYYYPEGYNFKDQLVGKRSKIISINDGVVKSRLINDKGEFIDDNVWEGTIDSAMNYIYESNRNLKFKFN